MAIPHTLLSTCPLAPRKSLRCFLVTVMGIAFGTPGVRAATITLTATDEYGTTSFNAAGHWSNGAAPNSGNAYVVTNMTLRTPSTSAVNRTFAGGSLTVNEGGLLGFKGGTGDVITINNLVLDGAGVGNWSTGSSFTLAGSITLGGGGVIFDTTASQHNIVVSSVISGGGGVWTRDGNVGIVALSAANPYMGDTTITSGTLQLNNANAVQNSTVIVGMDNGLAFGSGIGYFNVGGLAGDNLVTLTDTASNPVTLNVGGNGQTTTFAGSLAGSGGLTKAGNGTLVLAGSNTYTGDTAINAGRLEVNGAVLSPVTVNGGGTLSGTGSLGSVTVNAGGHLAPGDSLGTLSLSGSLTLQPRLILDYELGKISASDEISMPGQLLTLTDQQFSDFNFTPLAGFGPGTYTLIDAGSINGRLGTNVSGMIGGYTATLTMRNNSDLILNVTPEPSALVLLGVGTVGLLGYVRWQRNRWRPSPPFSFVGAPPISLDAHRDLHEGDPATLSSPSRWATVARRAA